MNGHLECVHAHDHVVNSFFPLLSPVRVQSIRTADNVAPRSVQNLPGVPENTRVLRNDIEKCAQVVAKHAKGKERLTHVRQNNRKGTGLYFAKDLLRSTGPHWPVCHTEIVTDEDCKQIADANLGRSGFQEGDKERTSTGKVYDERVRPVGPGLKIPEEVCAFCRTMAGDPYGGAFLECVQDTHSRTTSSHRDQCCVKAPCMRRRGWFDWCGIGDAYNHKEHGVAAMFYGNKNKSRDEVQQPGLMEYLMNFSANSNPYSGPRHLPETNEDYSGLKTNRYDDWANAWCDNVRTKHDLHKVVELGDLQHDAHLEAHRNMYNVRVAKTDKMNSYKAAKKLKDQEARQRAKDDKSLLKHLTCSFVESVDSEEDEDAGADNLTDEVGDVPGEDAGKGNFDTQIITSEEIGSQEGSPDEIVIEDEDDDEDESWNGDDDGDDDEDEWGRTNKFAKKRKDRVESDGEDDVNDSVSPSAARASFGVSQDERGSGDVSQDERGSGDETCKLQILKKQVSSAFQDDSGSGDEDDASLGGDENVSPSACALPAPPLTKAASTRSTTRRIAASNRTSKRKRTVRTRFS